MTSPANASVRERRRRSTPTDLEQMNVMKALTAAEHSRRQFVLNYAASKQTHLLMPGQKADAVKAAEECVVAWLSQKGLNPVSSEFFKYNVDAQLWTTHVGNHVEFPFSFMRANLQTSSSTTMPETRRRSETNGPASEAYPDDSAVELRNDDQISLSTSPSVAKPELPEARRPLKYQQQEQRSAEEIPQTPLERQSTKTKMRRSVVTETAADKKRSLSLNSIDDIKMRKPGQDKLPLFVRLGRSWSRRVSST